MRQTYPSTPTDLPLNLPTALSDSRWVVPIPGHRPYEHVCLRRVFAADDNSHVVVLVNLQTLLSCAGRDGTAYGLESVEDWDCKTADGMREFLNPQNEYVPCMPYVNLTRRRNSGLAGWLGLASTDIVVFRVGQRRSRYLAWAGAAWLPVEVRVQDTPLLRRLCGAANVITRRR